MINIKDIKYSYSHKEFSKIIHHVDKRSIVSGFEVVIIDSTINDGDDNNNDEIYTIILNVNPGTIYIKMDDSIYMATSEENEIINLQSNATVQTIGLVYDKNLRKLKIRHINNSITKSHYFIPFANIYMDKYNDVWRVETLIEHNVKQCFFFDKKNSIDCKERTENSRPPVRTIPKKIPKRRTPSLIPYKLIAEKQVWLSEEPYYFRRITWDNIKLKITPYKFFVENTAFQFKCHNPFMHTVNAETTMRLWVQDDLGNELDLYNKPYKYVISPKKTVPFLHNLSTVHKKEIDVNWEIKHVYLSIIVFPGYIYMQGDEDTNSTFALYIAQNDF